MKTSGMNGSIRYQRRTTSEWEKLIARFEQTGQTRKSFCLSQGVSMNTFDLPDYVPSSSELRTRNTIDLDGSPEAANRRSGRRKRRCVAA